MSVCTASGPVSSIEKGVSPSRRSDRRPSWEIWCCASTRRQTDTMRLRLTPLLLMLAGLMLFVGDLCAQSEDGRKLTRLKALDFVKSRLCQACDLAGLVGDCGCDFQTVNQANHQYFYPLLQELIKKTFFQYFKVNLRNPCPFWDEEHLCAIRDCEVLECQASEVPAVWVERDEQGRATRMCTSGLEGDDEDEKQQDEDAASLEAGGGSNATAAISSELEARLGGVDWSGAQAGANFTGWAEDSNRAVWIEQQDQEQQMTYVNLRRNPERFTGYAGMSAIRVWRSIYQENCFALGPSELDHSQCFEKRIFYRLISGLQSSISTHLALEYYDSAQDAWVRNTELYLEKVGRHPERVENLYFVYLFMMRALNKAADELATYDFSTGNPEDDAATANLMKDLVAWAGNPSSGDPSVVPVCQRGFDERRLFRWQGPPPQQDNAYLSSSSGVGSEAEMSELREEFFSKFHNISRIMDCVGCEKCKLWGKVQTLGLGTAIKILLHSEADLVEGDRFQFTRNEVIALVNTAHQLAKSVHAVGQWPEHEFDEKLHAWTVRAAWVLLAMGLVWAVLAQCLRVGWRRGGKLKEPPQPPQPRQQQRGTTAGRSKKVD